MNKKPVHALTISVVIIVFAWLMITRADFAFGKETYNIGDGPFVMAVSYTESYDDLQYVSNFVNCDKAMDYYNENCGGSYIMMCQLEDYLYMPIGHKSDTPFDFEPTDRQSCGFVGVQLEFTGGTDD
jgi:hypothetical protein